jgi:hypothetical protein
MNNNIKKVICSVCILIVFSTVAAAADNPIPDSASTLNWRYSGYNYSDSLLIGDYYTTERTGWCATHYTHPDSNKYNHVHVTSSAPYYSNMYQMTVTQSMIEAYWDWRYSGYVQTGSYDQTYNCYGYSTGHNTWIDSTGVSVILNDEYTATNTADAEIVYLSGEDHMLSITAYFSCPDDVTDACETYEKYRDSGIYKLFYLYQKWPDPDPVTFLNKSYEQK